jgi:hypothetical protein
MPLVGLAPVEAAVAPADDEALVPLRRASDSKSRLRSPPNKRLSQFNMVTSVWSLPNHRP